MRWGRLRIASLELKNTVGRGPSSPTNPLLLGKRSFLPPTPVLATAPPYRYRVKSPTFLNYRCAGGGLGVVAGFHASQQHLRAQS